MKINLGSEKEEALNIAIGNLECKILHQIMDRKVKILWLDHQDRHTWKERIVKVADFTFGGPNPQIADEEGNWLSVHPDTPIEIVE